MEDFGQAEAYTKRDVEAVNNNYVNREGPHECYCAYQVTNHPSLALANKLHLSNMFKWFSVNSRMPAKAEIDMSSRHACDSLTDIVSFIHHHPFLLQSLHSLHAENITINGWHKSPFYALVHLMGNLASRSSTFFKKRESLEAVWSTIAHGLLGSLDTYLARLPHFGTAHSPQLFLPYWCI